MKFFVLRALAYGVSLGLAFSSGVQAQAATGAVVGLPDFTVIVEKNAPAVVHVEAKYTGKRRKPSAESPAQSEPDDAGPDASGPGQRCSRRTAVRNAAAFLWHANDAVAG